MNKNTALQILDAAQQMVKVRGYNAFSYANLSKAVGICKASIHHHFPRKADLGRKLIVHYREVFRQQRARIQQTTDDPRQQLILFTQLYGNALREGYLCLCGMLAADYCTLPEGMRQEVKECFSENEAWLAEVIRKGCQAGVFRCQTSATVEAQFFLAELQGAQLITRASGRDAAQLETLVQRLLASL